MAQDEKLARWGYSRRGDKGVTNVLPVTTKPASKQNQTYAKEK